jgi:hypothetical protein
MRDTDAYLLRDAVQHLDGCLLHDDPLAHPHHDIPKQLCRNMAKQAIQKWLGLFEQLFPKDKWSHSWVDVLGKAQQS